MSCLIVLWMVACASPVEAAPPVALTPPVRVVAAPPAPAVRLGTVSRSLDRPVVSLALGRPRVAALVDDAGALVPWWLDGTWRPLPLPEALRVTDADLRTARIHFGRNDKPRIMGGRELDGVPQQLYLRFKGSAWTIDRDELEELAGPPLAPLWGLLGHPDPEVVCTQGGTCILKRLTGYTRMAAGPGMPRVDLHGALALAVHPTWVAVLDGTSWREVSTGATLQQARGAWGDGREVWISDDDGTVERLWHGVDGTFEAVASPVTDPRGLWGTGPSDVWLAGAEGLAHWDGAGWSRVEGVDGPLSEVLGRDGEVWAGGASGVWKVAR